MLNQIDEIEREIEQFRANLNGIQGVLDVLKQSHSELSKITQVGEQHLVEYAATSELFKTFNESASLESKQTLNELIKIVNEVRGIKSLLTNEDFVREALSLTIQKNVIDIEASEKRILQVFEIKDTNNQKRLDMFVDSFEQSNESLNMKVIDRIKAVSDESRAENNKNHETTINYLNQLALTQNGIKNMILDRNNDISSLITSMESLNTRLVKIDSENELSRKEIKDAEDKRRVATNFSLFLGIVNIFMIAFLIFSQ